ncbi:hypothetical protein AB4305_04510 [Nocardia sp. 2YAB30]|uniref:hypothetical protein n=1 Tax=unclassified Nocardia TaxID=2637762 RepID=UPI003F9ACC28
MPATEATTTMVPPYSPIHVLCAEPWFALPIGDRAVATIAAPGMPFLPHPDRVREVRT